MGQTKTSPWWDDITVDNHIALQDINCYIVPSFHSSGGISLEVCTQFINDYIYIWSITKLPRTLSITEVVNTYIDCSDIIKPHMCNFPMLDIAVCKAVIPKGTLYVSNSYCNSICANESRMASQKLIITEIVPKQKVLSILSEGIMTKEDEMFFQAMEAKLTAMDEQDLVHKFPRKKK